MRTQLLNKENAERQIMVVKNVDGSGSFTVGMAVALVAAGASIDGVSSVKDASQATHKGFCGIAQQNIPINGFGTVVAWGLADSVLLSHVGTSLTITRGDVLIWGGAAGTLFSSTFATNLSTLTQNNLVGAGMIRHVVAADTATISAAQYIRGLVRAL